MQQEVAVGGREKRRRQIRTKTTSTEEMKTCEGGEMGDLSLLSHRRNYKDG